jgi:hypothetical protein
MTFNWHAAAALAIGTAIAASVGCRASRPTNAPPTVRSVCNPDVACDLPEVAWKELVVGFDSEQTVKVLAEFKSALQASHNDSESFTATVSGVFAEAVGSRDGEDWMISQRASHAAHTLRAFLCFLSSERGKATYADMAALQPRIDALIHQVVRAEETANNPIASFAVDPGSNTVTVMLNPLFAYKVRFEKKEDSVQWFYFNGDQVWYDGNGENQSELRSTLDWQFTSSTVVILSKFQFKEVGVAVGRKRANGNPSACIEQNGTRLIASWGGDGSAHATCTIEAVAPY